MSKNYITTITKELGNNLSSQTVYTVPSNSKFICFKKSISAGSGGSGSSEEPDSVFVSGTGSDAYNGEYSSLEYTYQDHKMYENANGKYIMYDTSSYFGGYKWQIADTTEQISMVGGYFYSDTLIGTYTVGFDQDGTGWNAGQTAVVSGSSSPSQGQPSGTVTISDTNGTNAIIGVGNALKIKEVFSASEVITAQQSVEGSIVTLEGILFENDIPLYQNN